MARFISEATSQSTERSHLQISRHRIIVLRKWRSARKMWAGTISVLVCGLQMPRLLPGLWCDALVKWDTVCIVLMGAMEQ